MSIIGAEIRRIRASEANYTKDPFVFHVGDNHIYRLCRLGVDFAYTLHLTSIIGGRY